MVDHHCFQLWGTDSRVEEREQRHQEPATVIGVELDFHSLRRVPDQLQQIGGWKIHGSDYSAAWAGMDSSRNRMLADYRFVSGKNAKTTPAGAASQPQPSLHH